MHHIVLQQKASHPSQIPPGVRESFRKNLIGNGFDYDNWQIARHLAVNQLE
jgi:hypothetical protein